MDKRDDYSPHVESVGCRLRWLVVSNNMSSRISNIHPPRHRLSSSHCGTVRDRAERSAIDPFPPLMFRGLRSAVEQKADIRHVHKLRILSPQFPQFSERGNFRLHILPPKFRLRIRTPVTGRTARLDTRLVASDYPSRIPTH
jgi:hypothetical protein